MIGKTEMAAHNTAVVAAIAARKVTKFAARFPAGEAVLKIPAPDILADISPQGSHVANLRRRHHRRRLSERSVVLPHFLRTGDRRQSRERANSQAFIGGKTNVVL